MAGVIDFISDIFGAITAFVCRLLPDSPFKFLDANEEIKEMLGYLNFFFPIDFMVTTLELWIVAVGVYYLYQAYLRFSKVIGD